MIQPFRPAKLILIGASTRAAAFSAIRAGLQPICIDQFVDQDLTQVAKAFTLPNTDEEIMSLLARLPDLPVVYAGGMENRPDLLEKIAKTHQLWGMSAEVVRKIRDHQNLIEIARIARVGLPEMRPASDPPPRDGTWVIRPQLSGGGRAIQIWQEGVECKALAEDHFFQKKIEGQKFSAIFISTPGPGDVRFVGMTFQVQTTAEVLGTDFLWQGCYGPAALDIGVELNIRRFGNVAKWKLRMLGIFGVDFILDDAGVPWVTEVNPRYPASLEILEHVTGIPFFLEHCRCFSEVPLPDSEWNRPEPNEFLAKIVLYAPDDLTLNGDLFEPVPANPEAFPEYADLPATGQSFRLGDPVCTFFSEARSIEALHALIKMKMSQITDKLLDRSRNDSES